MVGCDDRGRTTLMNAVRFRKYDLAQRLLQTGVSADSQDKEGKTALHYASQSGFCVDVLLAASANVNISDFDGNTPLLLACAEGRCRLIRLLCESGADVNVSNFAGTSPLLLIAQKGHVECAEVLVRHGADVHAADDWLRLIRAAVDHGRSNMIYYILSITGGDLLRMESVCEQVYSLVNHHGLHQFIPTALAIGLRRERLTGLDASIDSVLSNPLELKQCCRVVVRSLLNTPVLSDVHRQLYLPSSLGLYLAMH